MKLLAPSSHLSLLNLTDDDKKDAPHSETFLGSRFKTGLWCVISVDISYENNQHSLKRKSFDSIYPS